MRFPIFIPTLEIFLNHDLYIVTTAYDTTDTLVINATGHRDWQLFKAIQVQPSFISPTAVGKRDGFHGNEREGGCSSSEGEVDHVGGVAKVAVCQQIAAREVLVKSYNIL